MRNFATNLSKVKNLAILAGLLFFAVLLSMTFVVPANATSVYFGFSNPNVGHASLSQGPNFAKEKDLLMHAGTTNEYPDLNFSTWVDKWSSIGMNLRIKQYTDGRLTRELQPEAVYQSGATQELDFSYLVVRVFPYKEKVICCVGSNNDATGSGIIYPKDDAINRLGNQEIRYEFLFWENKTPNVSSGATLVISRKHIGMIWSHGLNGAGTQAELTSGTYRSGGTTYPEVRGYAFSTHYDQSNIEFRSTEQLNTQPVKYAKWVQRGSHDVWDMGIDNYRFGTWHIYWNGVSGTNTCNTANGVNYIRCYTVRFVPNKAEIDNLKGNVHITIEIAHLEGNVEYMKRTLNFTIRGRTHHRPVASLYIPDSYKNGVREAQYSGANFVIFTSYGRIGRMKVYYSIAQTADFLTTFTTTPQLKFVWFENRQQHKGFRVNIQNDEIDEADAEVTVALVAEANYPYTIDANPAYNTITFAVRDDDVPTVSIASIPDTDPPPQVQEGPNVFARFKVTASIAPYQDLQVAYTFTQGGTNKIDSTYQLPSHITIAAGTTEATFSVKTTYNINANNNEGRIRVRLDPNSAQANAYNVATADADKMATVLLVNNDVPIISIAINSNSTPRVLEAENAKVDFDLTANIAASSAITVRVELSTTGSFINGSINRTATIAQNSTSGTLSVSITNDNVYEENGTITATILADDNSPKTYSVTNVTADKSATTSIIDDDVPTVSVRVHADSIPSVAEEPDTQVKFLFEADKLPRNALTLNIAVTESSGGSNDFIDESPTELETHTFGTDNLQSTLTIPIIFDEVDEDNGKVIVTLEDDTTVPWTYKIPAAPSEKIAEAEIVANTLPIISIALNSGTTASEAEADSLVLQFDITSNLNITGNNLVVNIGVSESHNMLVAEAMRENTATITAGSTTGVYQLSTINDNVDEFDSIITVSIEADNSSPKKYLYSSVIANRSQEVTVTDDDDPVISIRALAARVNEQPGGMAQFEITTTVLVEPGITVNILVETEDENFIDPSSTNPETVDILAPKLKEIVSIPLTYDQATEPNGKVKITLRDDGNNGINYTLAPTAADRVAVVEVVSNPSPQVSIAVHMDSNNGTTEAANAMVKFEVTAASMLSTTDNIDIIVEVTEEESSNFLPAVNTRPTSVTINANATSAILMVPIENDTTVEADGEIKVTLQPDTNIPAKYVISPTVANQSATATVRDDDKPVISIAVHADSKPHVLENPGAKIKFEISSTTASPEDLTIEFEISQEMGTYLLAATPSNPNPIPENIVLPANATSVTVEVPIAFAEADGGEGRIKAALEAHATDLSKYDITETVAMKTATAKVLNNPRPEITIAAHSDSTSGVTESDSAVAKFTVSSSVAIPTGLTISVRYTITESGSYIPTTQEKSGTAMLDASNQTRDISVAIANDSVNEANGTITVTLLADSSTHVTYTIPTAANDQKAVVNVKDDDAPVISVVVHTDSTPSVTETIGGEVKYTISSDIAPYEDLTIEFEVRETPGSYLPTATLSNPNPIPTNVVLTTGATSVVVNVPIQYTEADGGSSMIKLTLETHASDTTKYSITNTDAMKAATATVNNNSLPVIAIAAHSDSASGVTEADNVVAKFTISSNQAIPMGTTLSVGYGVESTGFLLPTQLATGSVSLDHMNQSKPVEIPVHNDEVDEANGTITLTLKKDTLLTKTYTIPGTATQQKASVNVTDNDVPIISIKVKTGSETVFETLGGVAQFEITASIAPHEDLTIGFTASEPSGDYLPETGVPVNKVLTKETTSVIVDIPIKYSTSNGGNHPIKVTLDSSSDTSKYTLNTDSTKQSAEATINDSPLPVITIVVHSDSSSGVTEGDNAVVKFTISSSIAIPVGTTLSVGYTITESQPLLHSSVEKSDSLDLNSTKQSDTITIRLDDDEIDEPDGKITLTLGEDSSMPKTYLIPGTAEARRAEVTVIDDDVPVISIAVKDSSNPVTETIGAVAQFDITADTAPHEDITIEFLATASEGDYLAGSGVPENTVMSADTNSKTIDIPLKYSPSRDGGGKVRVTLENHTSDSTKYTVTTDTSKQLAEAPVVESDLPIISIAVHDDSKSGVEEANGAEVKFTIASESPIANGVTLNISYQVTESHAFLSSSVAKTGITTLNSQNQSKVVSIAIENDNVDEANGTITMTLVEESSTTKTYAIPGTIANQSAVANVRDDEKPEISITVHPDSTSITEAPGAAAIFVISSNIEPFENVTVEFAVTESMGAYLSDTHIPPENAVIEASTKSTTISVPLKYTTTDEGTGKIKVTLENHATDSKKYTLNPDTTKQSAEATIINNTLPLVTISVHDDSTSGVQEADSAVVKFIISTESAIVAGVALNVGYNISESGAFLQSTQVVPVTLNSQTISSTIELAIENDNVDEMDGTVTLKLLEDTNTNKTYIIPATLIQQSATASVIDDDIPAVSITPSFPSIYKAPGAEAWYTVSTDIAPHQNLSISVEISSDDFLPATNLIPSTAEISAGNTTGDLIVPINYTTVITDGSITVQLTSVNQPTDYQVSTPNSAVVMIETSTIPIISVNVHSDSSQFVQEAASAKVKFEIKTTLVPTADLEVRIEITETADFLSDTTKMKSTETISANESSKLLELDVEDDMVNEAPGTLTVKILPDDRDPIEYRPNPNPKQATATANLRDDDIPVISIAVDPNSHASIEEGSSLNPTFQLTASIAPYQDLTISVQVDTVGEYFVQTYSEPIEVIIVGGTENKSFEIPLSGNDGNNTPNGLVEVEILPDAEDITTYEIDVQNFPIISIIEIINFKIPYISVVLHSPTSDTTVEGVNREIIFKMTADTPNKLSSPFEIHYELEALGDYIEPGDFNTRITQMGPDQSETEVTLRIKDDDLNETHGWIVLNLLTDPADLDSYKLDQNLANQSVSVKIIDDDFPILLVNAKEDQIVEGQTAEFELSSDTIRDEVLTVKFQVTEGKDFLQNPVNEFTRTFEIGDVSDILAIEFSTIDNQQEENTHRTIAVAIVDEDNDQYRTNSGILYPKSASVTIVDNDGDPTTYVSIREDLPIVEIGNKISFKLSAIHTQGQTQDFNVAVRVSSESDNIILWRVPTIVEIRNGRGQLKFYSQKNSEGGIVTATIVPGGDYELLKNSAQVTIQRTIRSAYDPNLPSISVASLIANTLLNMNSDPASENYQQSLLNNQQLPEVSIFTITQSIEEGQAVQFQISSSRQLNSTISIQIAISSKGNAVPDDYNSTVTLTSTQSNAVLEVPTHDDNIAEESDSVIVEVIESNSYLVSEPKLAIATVLDTHDRTQRQNQIEAANQQVVPKLINAIGRSTYTATNNHLDLAFSDNLRSSYNLSGENSLTGLITTGGHAINEDTLSLRSVLGESSFVFSLSPEQSGYNTSSVWGLGDQVDIFEENVDESHSLNGDVFVGHFGADTKLSQDSLVGLQVSLSESELTYQEFDRDEINYSVNTNMVSSYYGWSSAEHDLELRAIGGYGFGEFIINQADYTPLRLNSDFISTSVNGVANITSFGNQHQHGLNSLNLKAKSSIMQFTMQDDTNFISDFEFNSNLNQLITEYTYQKTFEQGSSLSSFTQIGGVWGQNNTNDGFGVEVNGGLEVTNLSGFEISGKGQYLLDQTNDFFENGGVKGELSFDKYNDQLGLQAKVSTSYGSITNQKSSDINLWTIFDRDITRNNPTTDVNSEITWGFNLNDSAIKLTPYYHLNIEEFELSSQRLGTKIGVGTISYITLEGKQEQIQNSVANYGVSITSKISW